MQNAVADDEEWAVLARIAAGDRAALAELYARHRGAIFGYLRSLVADPGLAEELLQDTLFAAWTGAARFDKRSSARVWLLGIARHRALDAVRRRTFRVVDAAALEPIPDPTPEPEAWAIADAEGDALRAALTRLRPFHREVLVLNFVQELPYQAIAEVLHVPIGTVMSRLHYAKRALRAELEAEVRP
jgi:RNA polymerase sigma-70 factor (ECF subfamily)